MPNGSLTRSQNCHPMSFDVIRLSMGEREGEDNRKKVTARMQSADIEQRSQLMKSNTGTLHVHPLALF